jgi:XTP/dITP diphosphohydrolase
VKKELGDLMLHMVFYAKIGQEQGVFDITDVLNGICDKLIRRHPHIYGDVTVKDDEEVKANWEKIKLAERSVDGIGSYAIPQRSGQGVPRGLPSLVKAIRVQDKARGVGFDWDDARPSVGGRCRKNWRTEARGGCRFQQNRPRSWAMCLFSLVNYARFLGIDPG